MIIGEIILQRRKELKMTQKQLAEKLNVTDKTVSRWECGINLPDVEMLKTIAEVLEVDVKYFYEDVKIKVINQTEEYDYNKIKSYKTKNIVPFILVGISIVITIICKFILSELTSPLFLLSNIYSIINYAFSENIINAVGIILIFIGISLIISIISHSLFLKNSIDFKYFYKEKMFQSQYLYVHKRSRIIYYLLLIFSIICILF